MVAVTIPNSEYNNPITKVMLRLLPPEVWIRCLFSTSRQRAALLKMKKDEVRPTEMVLTLNKRYPSLTLSVTGS